MVISRREGWTCTDCLENRHTRIHQKPPPAGVRWGSEPAVTKSRAVVTTWGMWEEGGAAELTRLARKIYALRFSCRWSVFTQWSAERRRCGAAAHVKSPSVSTFWFQRVWKIFHRLCWIRRRMIKGSSCGFFCFCFCLFDFSKPFLYLQVLSKLFGALVRPAHLPHTSVFMSHPETSNC